MKIFRANWFPFSLGVIILFVVAKDIIQSKNTKPRAINAIFREPELKVDWWEAPPLWELPNGEEGNLIKYGRSLIANTSTYIGPKGLLSASGNGMNCQNCHLDAGTKPWGNNYSAVYSTYPKYRERSGGLESISKRVNDCLQRSLNSEPIDSNSSEMLAIISYMKWMGQNVKKGEKPKGAGISDLPLLDRPADPAIGKKIYTETCARCHGSDGQGVSDPFNTSYIYPPLWGPNSYTTAAGLFRVSRFAGYIKDNMPFGATHHRSQLTNEQAWDIAAFVNSQPRPQKDFKEDWPDVAGKPFDHPFGPYADSFSEKQHKYGPFAPIIKFKEEPVQKTNNANPENNKHYIMSSIQHLSSCSCGCHDENTGNDPQQSRRDFLKLTGAVGAGILGSPLLANALTGEELQHRKILESKTIQRGKAGVFTLLHTSDIHAQLYTHDEFFWEKGKPVYKKRGGFAVLKTMLQKLRAENPQNTLLIDGGDCLQGGGLAALTQGKAIVPLINNLGYDLILPGNWEVVYGKQMLMQDLGQCHSNKICANMFHDTTDEFKNELMFQPYWIRMIAGVKIGFIGYNDPLTPKRQSPAYSYGIRFTRPEENVARYIKILKEYEGCAMVFLLTHMGLAQQVDLSNRKEVQGVDFILGADTHERVRKPIEGRFAKVTEPGAFGSFVARLDVVVENGVVKDSNYQLLDVDPTKYKPDPTTATLIEKQRLPHKKELDKVIGKTKTPLVRYYVIENPMDNMITDALMWKYKDAGTDIVLSNGFRFCPPLVPDRKTGHALITNDFLWSMIPVDSEVKKGEATGKQIWDWLERELHNVFANNPAERFGGWVIRFKGMEINFTMKNELNQRLNWVKINGASLIPGKEYTIVACEREGDPNDALCRMDQIKNPRKTGHNMHNVIREYLAVHSPVSPIIEGRITATDAPANLLSQLEGYDYTFR